MPRQKGDGRGRLGGRAKGTPNKVDALVKKGFQEIYENNIGFVQEHLDALAKADEHDKWLNFFFQYSRFVQPLKRSVEVSATVQKSDLASEIEAMAMRERED